MRTFLIIGILEFIFLFTFAQEKNRHYPYEYKLRLFDSGKSLPIQIDTFILKNKTSNFSGQFIDDLLLPITHATVMAKSKGSNYIFFTDKNGKFSYPLLPGNYSIILQSGLYSTINLPLSWQGSTNYECRFNIRKRPKRGIFHIYSKKELSDSQIESIKNCLWYNTSDMKDCWRKDEYYIMKEI